MASSKNRRRRGGHPAKEAQRRERERARREASSDPLRRVAKTICREAAELEDALDGELWASALLGSWWPRRHDRFDADDEGVDLEIGGPLVAEVARLGGPGAMAALSAIGELSDGELGVRALSHVATLLAAGVPRPTWGEAIGEAHVLRTAVMREDIFDDGITIFVEATHDDGEPHAIGVYIDHNLGMIAKDILLADSIDRVEELMSSSNPDEQVPLRLEPIGQPEACARIHDAMAMTDMTLDPPVGDDYASLRALALLRADELSGPMAEVPTPEVSTEARERMLSDFCRSPEGEGFALDGDEAFVASLAIDFCADYVDGQPLRWSPVVVEIFMTDWLPRKVLADHSTFEAVPAALDAWLRYAGRLRGIPDWAIRRSTEEIGIWTEEMLETLEAGHGGGMAKDLLTAAEAAGVDIADQAALATFIAGWNARSDTA